MPAEAITVIDRAMSGSRLSTGQTEHPVRGQGQRLAWGDGKHRCLGNDNCHRTDFGPDLSDPCGSRRLVALRVRVSPSVIAIPIGDSSVRRQVGPARTYTSSSAQLEAAPNKGRRQCTQEGAPIVFLNAG
jgi:hypothetical protein